MVMGLRPRRAGPAARTYPGSQWWGAGRSWSPSPTAGLGSPAASPWVHRPGPWPQASFVCPGVCRNHTACSQRGPTGPSTCAAASPPSSTKGPSWVCCTPRRTNPTGPRGSQGNRPPAQLAVDGPILPVEHSLPPNGACRAPQGQPGASPASCSRGPRALTFQLPPNTNSRSRPLSPTLCAPGDGGQSLEMVLLP